MLSSYITQNKDLWEKSFPGFYSNNSFLTNDFVSSLLDIELIDFISFSLFFFFFFWYVHKEYNSYSQNNDGLIDTLLGPKGPTSMDDSVEFLRAWMFGSH